MVESGVLLGLSCPDAREHVLIAAPHSSSLQEDGKVFKITKGAPNILLQLVVDDAMTKKAAETLVRCVADACLNLGCLGRGGGGALHTLVTPHANFLQDDT